MNSQHIADMTQSTPLMP